MYNQMFVPYSQQLNKDQSYVNCKLEENSFPINTKPPIQSNYFHYLQLVARINYVRAKNESYSSSI